jgi:hypothetical protein
MPITTYAELQTTIGDWINRNNPRITAAIPTFITIGEAHINRKHSVFPLMAEAVTDLTYGASDTTKSIDLPSDFVSLVGIHIKPAGSADIQYRPLRQSSSRDQRHCSAGEPSAAWIHGGKIFFDSLVGSGYTIRLIYRKKWNIATDLTNWLLTNHPDIYLYSSLVAAEPFMRNEKRLPTWKAMLKEAMEELGRVAQQTRSKAESDFSHFPGYVSGYDVVGDR